MYTVVLVIYSLSGEQPHHVDGVFVLTLHTGNLHLISLYRNGACYGTALENLKTNKI